ncbi:hypothetical protein B7494_g4440 [Chlorociboria aeruginascens]|nr:hypothetical protein B7494_g4440 [Chlorociboria aeruginascens]
MGIPTRCLAQLGRLSLSPGHHSIAFTPASFVATMTQIRLASTSKKDAAGGKSNAQRMKKKTVEKKKKTRTSFIQYDMRDAIQFSLCDAMRYIRAFEVGRAPTSSKYEMHVKLKTLKNGPVLRSRLRLPHPVKTDVRICVICPPDSKYAESARAAGAVLVGEEEVFEAVKDGKIDFDRCICQTDSLAKMNKAGMPRILGPRGLMPNTKLGTVVKDPSIMMKDLVGAAEYRERMGVVRMAVGQLGFTPEEMQRNIKTFIDSLKKDMAAMSDKISKDIAEVVLSSTNSPGFPLNGTFRNPNSDITTRDLSTPS